MVSKQYTLCMFFRDMVYGWVSDSGSDIFAPETLFKKTLEMDYLVMLHIKYHCFIPYLGVSDKTIYMLSLSKTCVSTSGEAVQPQVHNLIENSNSLQGNNTYQISRLLVTWFMT